MSLSNTVEEEKNDYKNQKQNALSKLREFIDKKIQLKRPTFLVPGWTDESCSCWIRPFKENESIKYWFDNIFIDSGKIEYINFEKESPNCNSFFDFGEVLKNKIWNSIGKNAKFDIIGHSMGGLDIRAAISDENPLLNVHNCLTVATPHQGDNFGGVNIWSRRAPIIRSIIEWVMPQKPYQIIQSRALDPDYAQIQDVNKTKNKEAFLERINKLYQFKGTRDFTVKGSAYINEKDLDSKLCKEKIDYVEIDGADHVGLVGITQDPRTILKIIEILSDLPLEKPEKNYGIFVGGMQYYNK